MSGSARLRVLPSTALNQPAPRGKSMWEPAAQGAGHLSSDGVDGANEYWKLILLRPFYFAGTQGKAVLGGRDCSRVVA